MLLLFPSSPSFHLFPPPFFLFSHACIHYVYYYFRILPFPLCFLSPFLKLLLTQIFVLSLAQLSFLNSAFTLTHFSLSLSLSLYLMLLLLAGCLSVLCKGHLRAVNISQGPPLTRPAAGWDGMGWAGMGWAGSGGKHNIYRLTDGRTDERANWLAPQESSRVVLSASNCLTTLLINPKLILFAPFHPPWLLKGVLIRGVECGSLASFRGPRGRQNPYLNKITQPTQPLLSMFDNEHEF